MLETAVNEPDRPPRAPRLATASDAASRGLFGAGPCDETVAFSGSHREAQVFLERAGTVFPEGGERARVFEAGCALAVVLYDRNRFEEARALLAELQALEADGTLPDRLELRRLEGRFARREGRAEEARARFQAILDQPAAGDSRLSELRAWAAFELGKLELSGERLHRAAARFDEVLEHGPEDPVSDRLLVLARLERALVAIYLGERQLAGTLIGEAAGLVDPSQERDEISLAHVTGVFHFWRGDHPAATVQFLRGLEAASAVQRSGPWAQAFNGYLAATLRRQGATDAALELHERVHFEHPVAVAAGLLQWGLTLVAAGRSQEAREKLGAARVALGEDLLPCTRAAIHMALAVIARRRGEPQEALTNIEAAAALIESGPYYYALVQWPELASEVLDLLIAAGRHDIVTRVESLFPEDVGRIRSEGGPGPVSASASARAWPLVIRCLGRIEVVVGSDPVLRWPRKKVKVLLGALLLAEKGIGRHRLEEIVFPESGGDVSSYLDILVSALRRLLEPGLGHRQPSRYLQVRDQYYCFEASGAWIDIFEFEQLHRRATAALRSDRELEAIATLERAIALYRGDLLGDEECLDAFIFPRQRYRLMAIEILERLAEHYLGGSDPEKGRAFAERLLGIEPVHEEAHRHLMRFYGRSGRLELVAAQFNLCRQSLESEIEAEPSEETVALYHRLMTGTD